MNIQETRAKIISSIWQAIAQSGVDLQTIPQDQQARLVDGIANQTLHIFNALLDEMQPAPVEVAQAEPEKAEPEDPNAEKILWSGRPFLSLIENYLLTSERLKITRGLLGRDVENFELIRVQDIDLKQGLSERIMGIGDIEISGQDPSNPKVILRNISRPEEVYEIMRRAWLDARKRHGLQFREYM